MGCPIRKTSEDHICSGKVTLFPGTDTIYSNNSKKNTTSCGKKNNETTVSNGKVGKSTLMDCLHSEAEIQAVYDVFHNNLLEARTVAKKRTAMRNITMFVCAINLGLRGGDLCSLKWNNIFDKNWEFLYQPDFVPQKTKRYKKHVKLTWNYDVEDVLIDWLNWLSEHGEPQKLDDFIFTSPKVSFDKETGKCLGNAIQVRSFWRIMEKTRKEAGIKQKIGTHGCRKTMVNRHIKLSDDKTEGLIEMQGYLNHSSARITLGYACVTQEKIQQTKDRMAFLR